MKKTILICSLLFAIPGLCNENFQKLTVTGSSTVYKPSDKLTMTVGVVTQDKEVRLAMRSNAEKMTPIFETLKKLGLTEKEYHTGTYTIHPMYTQQPKYPPPDWRPAISGYEVRNTISIQTKKLELAGPIIDSVGKSGGNLVENISFSIDNEQSAKSEAIAQAVQQARAYADSAAKAAGIALGPIRELTINPSMTGSKQLRSYAVNETSTPISPGDVEVSANVEIVYELKQ